MQAFFELSKSKQMLIVSAFFFLIVLGTGFLAYSGLSVLGADLDSKVPKALLRDKNPENLVLTIDRIKTEVANLQRKIDQHPAVLKELDEIKKKYEKTKELLPDKKEANNSEMRGKMDEIASSIKGNYGVVRLVAFSIHDGSGRSSRRKKKSNSPFKKILYKCELDTDINGLISFVDKVESFPKRFLSVDNIVLKSGSVKASEEDNLEDVSYGMHKVNLDIVTYVYTGGDKK